MKILFISRATLFTVKGGDTIQVINTARYLVKLGIEVAIKLCNEKINYSGYDLIHFFNIIRPADILNHIRHSGKPYVISPIFVDYDEFEKNNRKSFTGFIGRILSPDRMEYVKVIARLIVNGEKIISPSYLLLGHKKAIREILQKTSMVLPNSYNEYLRLNARYQVTKPYKIIPNAIDPEIFKSSIPIGERETNMVLCVGRIEGIKNQLNLVKALNGTKYQLILIGAASVNHKNYYKLCKETAASNITFIDNLPQEELVGYYKKAKVHVLPSWFETTGLSSLEAAAMGCNIVITDRGDTKEYFENWAYYCDPALPASILDAVEKASKEDFKESLRTKIFSAYTWPEAAKKTLEAYQEIIGYTD